jgi:hypothetical protein
MRLLAFSLTLALAAHARPPSVTSAKHERVEAPAPQKPLSEVLSGTARVAYESGRLLLEAEDSATAHAKFKEAYELSKSPRLLWNMAACSKLQRRYAMAVEELERFISDGAGQITAEQEGRARELLETLRAVVAPVTVRVSPASATLFIDGEPRTTAGGEHRFLADVGRHEFRAELDAHAVARRSLDINETRPIFVDLTLAPIIPDATLVVATLADAAVELDGQAFSIGSREAVVAPGSHQLRVLARDYLPWSADVSVGVGEHRSVTARLDPEPKPNWWVIGTGAFLTVAALGVGSYYLFRPETPAAPPPVYLAPIPGSVATLPLP